MKHSALSTTALVAVGSLGTLPAEAKIQLGLSGYMNTFFSVASIDEGGNETRDFNSTGLFSDGEVHFNGEYTHDNGIAFGAVVELEMFGDFNSGGDTIDEKYMYVEATWGRIVAGSTNSASYKMQYFAPYAGLPINSGWVTVFIPPNPDSTVVFEHPDTGTLIDIQGDNNVFTYYTPRLWGFQLGLSYMPTVVGGGDGKNFPVEADTETEYHNGFSVGLNYVEDFNGFGVAISGGWLFAQVDETRKSLGAENYSAFVVGANFNYEGFTLGGSYANEYQGAVDSTSTFTTEGSAWDVGATYNLGPWTFGLTYVHGTADGDFADPDEDKMQALQGGFFYDLGPGITLAGGVMWGEWEAESGFTNSGVAGALGLSFGF